jgi:hypothetical protein
MRSTLSGWEVDLTPWLKPFLDRLGHKARRRIATPVAVAQSHIHGVFSAPFPSAVARSSSIIASVTRIASSRRDAPAQNQVMSGIERGHLLGTGGFAVTCLLRYSKADRSRERGCG